MENISENIQQFFVDHPVWYIIFFILLGIMGLCAAIFDWNWIFNVDNPNNYNTQKLEGLINTFGRKTARVLFGIICSLIIVISIFCFIM